MNYASVEMHNSTITGDEIRLDLMNPGPDQEKSLCPNNDSVEA